MVINSRTVLPAVLLFAAGCASLDASMEAWIGRYESELRSTWGPPHESAQLDEGGKTLTYRNVRASVPPGGRPVAATPVNPCAVKSGLAAVTHDTRRFWIDATGKIYRWTR